MQISKDFERLSKTAAPVVYGRTFSDIPYSKELAEICRVDSLISDSYRKTNRLIAPYIEARFKALSNILRQSGIKNIIEIGSGLSQRGLIMTKDKTIHYVETDLPDMIRYKREVLQKLLDQKNRHFPENLHLYELNALDKKTFKEIVSKLPPGPVAIGCEGFLAHLTRGERAKSAKIIREILDERGGIWVTPDVFTRTQLQTLLSGKSEREVTIEVTKSTGRNYNSNSFEDEGNARKFFSDLGFKYQVQTLGRTAGELNSIKIGLNEESVKNQLALNIFTLK